LLSASRTCEKAPLQQAQSGSAWKAPGSIRRSQLGFLQITELAGTYDNGYLVRTQCSAVQCSAVQCSAVQCSEVQCRAVQCSAVQCSAVQCSAVQCSAGQCRACTAEMAYLYTDHPARPASRILFVSFTDHSTGPPLHRPFHLLWIIAPDTSCTRRRFCMHHRPGCRGLTLFSETYQTTSRFNSGLLLQLRPPTSTPASCFKYCGINLPVSLTSPRAGPIIRPRGPSGGPAKARRLPITFHSARATQHALTKHTSCSVRHTPQSRRHRCSSSLSPQGKQTLSLSREVLIESHESLFKGIKIHQHFTQGRKPPLHSRQQR
jgi:hypothetical protein